MTTNPYPPQANQTPTILNLDSSQHFSGDDFAAFKMRMIAGGAAKGHTIYWLNQVINPHNTPIVYPTGQARYTPTPISSLNPTPVKYGLCKAAALAALISNISDPISVRIDIGKKSYENWASMFSNDDSRTTVSITGTWPFTYSYT